MTLWVPLIGLALLFDVANGFHDSANSVATVVSTRVLSPTAAVVWAAFFNFIAFFIFKTKVANSIADGVHREYITLGLVGAAVELATLSLQTVGASKAKDRLVAALECQISCCRRRLEQLIP
jgi:inorganic phosphate transporter, PiT family